MSVQNNITIEKDSFTFKLTNPIHYGEGGQQIEAFDLTVTGPTGKDKLLCFKLEQLYFQATLQASALFSHIQSSAKNTGMKEKDEDEATEGINAQSVGMFFKASDVDIEKALELLGQLAVKGGVHTNTVKLTPIRWNEIDEDDKLNLLFEYCSFFISASDSSVS